MRSTIPWVQRQSHAENVSGYLCVFEMSQIGYLYWRFLKTEGA